MAKHLIRATLEVWVDDGTYWPASISAAVANNPEDPYKDVGSHLASFIHHAMDSLHGVAFDTVEISIVRSVHDDTCFTTTTGEQK